ncbi:two-component regulator propeller domain-containing protein [Flavobacterium sp. NG2]|uniref:type IX secretion system anionic LPS delivery protein PorZ n=1 Tax=Flavobacterium sp. NG2 TaxID=3097547 RepID=UPI002A832849|nr:two-component regulator propeller domain-containing protein [Flavobacterium sp. NG2]WPR72074.1 two-component regulator propeller domain-containing protein [Flavobacterium sp. NG2]
MKKEVLSFLLLLMMQLGFSQTNLSWQGYFSYNEIKDISASATSIVSASENALFSINTTSNEIKTTTTVDGLSGESISALYYSSALNKTLVGYQNGLMTVVDESTGKILKVVDILNKQLPSSIKKVNHFMEYQGIVYVSCDFGIVQFNLNTMLFGDTYFIGDNGAEIKVTQTAVFNGYLYAATISGIKRALVANKNLIDFNQWEQVTSGSWVGIETFGTELVAVNESGSIFKYSNNAFVNTKNLNQTINDVRAVGGYLLVTSSSSVYVYNNQLVLIRQIDNSQVSEAVSSFVCATVIGDRIYIGTKENGLYSSTITVSSSFINVTPSGPSKNNIFAIDVAPNSLWAVYGFYNIFYDPYPLKTFGLSKFSSNGWLNIPYQNVFGAKSMSHILINPNNENEVYASSYFSGLLKIVNDEPVILYNEKNSGLETLTFIGPNYIDVRINGTAFDKNGDLWVTNSLVKNGLKVLRSNGDWQKFSTVTILGSNSEEEPFGKIVIDKNGTKWMGTYKDGVVGFNEKTNVFKRFGFGENEGNMPSNDTRAVAVDNNGQLWVGTSKGLRVLSNVNSFQTDDKLTTKAVIILEDGLAQELMYEQFITDIVVDGANNKWIATIDSGLFLVSPDGQKTIYHFTVNNSPLPSNTINDVVIRGTTGEVFIATAKGLVSFKGIATKASADLSNAYVYPNPVRPGYQGTVKISGLIDKANVKITDVEGNLVYETISEGGTIEWDTTAFGNYKVASGVYMIFISAEDGIETKIKKVMIVR